jgi:ABC-type transport system involved in multi-copper enzyme maturation permease subunit
MVAQVVRGHTPVDFAAYLLINVIVVVPSIIFMTSFVVMLNVLLRNKYVTYIVAFGTGAGLFYLYSNGYNHWLYNPVLYRLWKYSDLTSLTILGYRLYCLVVAAVCLAIAHICFERKS